MCHFSSHQAEKSILSENFGTIKDTGTACKESKIGTKIWQVFSLLRTENANRLSISRLRGAGEVFRLLPSVKTPHRPRLRLPFHLLLHPLYATASTSANKKTHSVEHVFLLQIAFLTLDVVGEI